MQVALFALPLPSSAPGGCPKIPTAPASSGPEAGDTFASLLAAQGGDGAEAAPMGGDPTEENDTTPDFAGTPEDRTKPETNAPAAVALPVDPGMTVPVAPVPIAAEVPVAVPAADAAPATTAPADPSETTFPDPTLPDQDDGQRVGRHRGHPDGVRGRPAQRGWTQVPRAAAGAEHCNENAVTEVENASAEKPADCPRAGPPVGPPEKRGNDCRGPETRVWKRLPGIPGDKVLQLPAEAFHSRRLAALENAPAATVTTPTSEAAIPLIPGLVPECTPSAWGIAASEAAGPAPAAAVPGSTGGVSNPIRRPTGSPLDPVRITTGAPGSSEDGESSPVVPVAAVLPEGLTGDAPLTVRFHGSWNLATPRDPVPGAWPAPTVSSARAAAMSANAGPTAQARPPLAALDEPRAVTPIQLMPLDTPVAVSPILLSPLAAPAIPEAPTTSDPAAEPDAAATPASADGTARQPSPPLLTLASSIPRARPLATVGRPVDASAARGIPKTGDGAPETSMPAVVPEEAREANSSESAVRATPPPLLAVEAVAASGVRPVKPAAITQPAGPGAATTPRQQGTDTTPARGPVLQTAEPEGASPQASEPGVLADDPALAKAEATPVLNSRRTDGAGAALVRENLAGSRSTNANGQGAKRAGAADGRFLNVDEEAIGAQRGELGTRIADKTANMSQKPLAEPAVESLRDALGTLPGAADSSLRRSETPANAPAPEGSALRSYAAAAVREILAAAERQPQTGRPQVDLRLQTFDHENVQVQMRWHNGVIETRFVTDTPELQQALSREWQTAAPQMAEKGLKFADPSFDRHDHDSSEKQPGQADSSFGQQRHTRGDSDSERPAPVFGVPTFLAAARANAELPADLPAQARRLDAEPNPNSRKLHAWA